MPYTNIVVRKSAETVVDKPTASRPVVELSRQIKMCFNNWAIADNNISVTKRDYKNNIVRAKDHQRYVNLGLESKEERKKYGYRDSNMRERDNAEDKFFAIVAPQREKLCYLLNDYPLLHPWSKPLWARLFVLESDKNIRVFPI
ncbi:TPA: hypothetical protein ACYURS_003210 [Legionella pneumophila]